MKTMAILSALFTSAFIFYVSVDVAAAQYRPGLQTAPSSQPTLKAQQPQASQNSAFQADRNSQPLAAQNSNLKGLPKPVVIEPDRPWKLTSRIHLEKGTNKGYLVVQLDLDEGYHVYSLNPKGSPSPTKLAVLPSNDLKVQSKFASDKAPKVIEKDPVFEQRIEKHSGQVQFFASIIVRPGVDLQKLKQEVQFSGQICSDSACQPVRSQTANAAFSGFFEVPKASSTPKNSNTRSAAGTQQLK